LISVAWVIHQASYTPTKEPIHDDIAKPAGILRDYNVFLRLAIPLKENVQISFVV